MGGRPGSHPLWKGLGEIGSNGETSRDGDGKKGLPSQGGFGSLIDGSKSRRARQFIRARGFALRVSVAFLKRFFTGLRISGCIFGLAREIARSGALETAFEAAGRLAFPFGGSLGRAGQMFDNLVGRKCSQSSDL